MMFARKDGNDRVGIGDVKDGLFQPFINMNRRDFFVLFGKDVYDAVKNTPSPHVVEIECRVAKRGYQALVADLFKPVEKPPLDIQPLGADPHIIEGSEEAPLPEPAPKTPEKISCEEYVRRQQEAQNGKG